MRFHCGISFSWRTIKKFIFPILIGILAYFGLDFLGNGFIKVFALENYESWYDYNYTDLSTYENQYVDSNNVKLIDFVNTIKNRSDFTYEYTIAFTIVNNSLSKLYFWTYSTNQNYKFSIYGKGTNMVFKNDYYTTNGNFYSITLGSISDIYNDTNYLDFISCATTNTSCNSSAYWGSEYTSFAAGTTTLNNTDNFTFTSNSIVLYYSTHDLIITNTYATTNSNRFYKSLRVNNEFVNVGSKFPTYTDYVESQNQPTPSPDPVPDDPSNPNENIEHKSIFNKVYWFDDNTTSIGVLSNIYILLFFYIFGTLFLKFITIIHNTKWKNRR